VLVFQKAQRLGARGISAFGVRSDGARADVHGQTVESLPLEMGATQYDLTLWVAEGDDGLTLQLDYREDLFDAPAIDRMLEQYKALLASIITPPDRPTSRLDLLPVAERALVLQAWNATAAEYPREVGLPDMVREQASRTPSAIAV